MLQHHILASWVYRRWLIDRVVGDDPDLNRYTALMHIMFSTEFKVCVPGDINRHDDGLYLRTLFSEETGTPEEIINEHALLGCSFLEMLVALSERMWYSSTSLEMQTVGDAFYELIFNMDLQNVDDTYVDNDFEEAFERITHACWIVNQRDYLEDGVGGSLFPIPGFTDFDFRETELWYQMQAYISKQDDIFNDNIYQ